MAELKLLSIYLCCGSDGIPAVGKAVVETFDIGHADGATGSEGCSIAVAGLAAVGAYAKLILCATVEASEGDVVQRGGVIEAPSVVAVVAAVFNLPNAVGSSSPLKSGLVVGDLGDRNDRLGTARRTVCIEYDGVAGVDNIAVVIVRVGHIAGATPVVVVYRGIAVQRLGIEAAIAGIATGVVVDSDNQVAAAVVVIRSGEGDGAKAVGNDVPRKVGVDEGELAKRNEVGVGIKYIL